MLCIIDRASHLLNNHNSEGDEVTRYPGVIYASPERRTGWVYVCETIGPDAHPTGWGYGREVETPPFLPNRAKAPEMLYRIPETSSLIYMVGGGDLFDETADVATCKPGVKPAGMARLMAVVERRGRVVVPTTYFRDRFPASVFAAIEAAGGDMNDVRVVF